MTIFSSANGFAGTGFLARDKSDRYQDSATEP